MPPILQCDIRWEKLRQKLESLPGGLQKMTRTRGRMIGMLLLGEIKRQIIRKSRNRTGELTASWRMDPVVEWQGKDLRIVLGSTSVYSRIQEMGGTIYPKSGQYLTVPLRSYRKGTIPPARELWRSGKTFIRNGVIYEKLGTGGKGNANQIRPLYVLRRQVTLAGKWYVTGALRFYKNKIRDAFGEGVKAAIKA